MIRQPPAYVPRDSISAQTTFTQIGMPDPVVEPWMVSAISTMPIAFWASWRPCPSAIDAADTVCAIRKPRFTLCGLDLRKNHRIASMTP